MSTAPRKDSNKSTDKTNLSTHLATTQCVANILKTLTAPILIIYFLLFHHSSISSIFSLLPQKLAQAHKVSVGSLELEIDRQVQSYGVPELKNTIGSLSRKALEMLLIKIPQSPHIFSSGNIRTETGKIIDTYYIPSEQYIQSIKELEKSKLIKAIMTIDEWQKKIDKELTFYKEQPMPDGSTIRAFIPKNGNPKLDFNTESSFHNIKLELTPLGMMAAEVIMNSVVIQLEKQPASKRMVEP